MDKLEKFITDNREQLDAKEPDSRIWGRIEGDILNNQKKIWQTGGFLWKAASIVLLLTVIGLVVDKSGLLSDKDLVVQSENSEVDLGEVEKFYADIILTRQEQIKEYVDKYPELDQRFLNDLNRLDENYGTLKKEMESGYNEKVLNAMIVNLQMQINVLNQQMEIIENIKNLREDEEINI